MRSDPLDVAIAIQVGRGTVRKMRQNLTWAIGYNAIALPIAAGVFEPVLGLTLRPEIAALTMSGSSIIVAANAVLLKRLRLPQAEADGALTPATPATPPVHLERHTPPTVDLTSSQALDQRAHETHQGG